MTSGKGQAAGLCSGRVGGRDLVVRSGLPVHTDGPIDAVELPAAFAKFLLERHGGSVEKWFAELAAKVASLGASELSALARAREVGGAVEAQRWQAERGDGLTPAEVAAHRVARRASLAAASGGPEGSSGAVAWELIG